jgi:NAD+ synthase
MQQLTQNVIQWIKDYFKDNTDGKVIIGISGGKDSTIVATLCVRALGANRVIGVLMPNGRQSDIYDSYRVCAYLGIKFFTVDICDSYCKLLKEIRASTRITDIPSAVETNLPSRLRMCTLYTIAAMYPNSRVVNTSNFSERYIGYSTKFGDGVGDFSPIGNLTVREVLAIGDDLGLPHELVHKTPSDGMSGMSDEDKLGFTYEELDDYIDHKDISDEAKAKIERLHAINLHKMKDMPRFKEEYNWIIKEEFKVNYDEHI